MGRHRISVRRFSLKFSASRLVARLCRAQVSFRERGSQKGVPLLESAFAKPHWVGLAHSQQGLRCGRLVDRPNDGAERIAVVVRKLPAVTGSGAVWASTTPSRSSRPPSSHNSARSCRSPAATRVRCGWHPTWARLAEYCPWWTSA